MIPPMVWATQKYFESNSVLGVFTSEHYSENDYIHDYSDFINKVTENEVETWLRKTKTDNLI